MEFNESCSTLEVDEASKAISSPTSGFKDGTLDTPGFSDDGTLLSPYAVPGTLLREDTDWCL